MIQHYWIVGPKEQRESLPHFCQFLMEALGQLLGKLVEYLGIMREQLAGCVRGQFQCASVNPRRGEESGRILRNQHGAPPRDGGAPRQTSQSPEQSGPDDLPWQELGVDAAPERRRLRGQDPPRRHRHRPTCRGLCSWGQTPRTRLPCLADKLKIQSRATELDNLGIPIGVGGNGVAGCTLHKRGGNCAAPNDLGSSTVAVVLGDGFVPAEEIRNLERG